MADQKPTTESVAARTRIITVFIGIIIVIGLLIAYLWYIRHRIMETPAGVELAQPPKIESIPGAGKTTTEYEKILREQQLKEAEEAAKTGKSAVPTISRESYFGPSEFQAPGKPGCSPDELRRARTAGVTAEELRCKGCTLAELRAAGYTAGELANAGFSAADLKNAGFTANDLKGAGFTAAELKRAGFTPGQLAAAGFNAGQLSQAGFSPSDLQDAGLSATDLAAAGIGPRVAGLPKDCSIDALRRARAQGISAGQLRGLGCGAAALRAAGYTPAELRAAGFSPEELRAAGFSPKDLKDAGFSAGELRRAGFGANDLRAAGFSPQDLRTAGYSAGDLANAGFTPDQLRNAGYSDGDLTRAGITPTAMAVTPPTAAAVTPAQPTGAPSAIPSVSSPDIALAQLQARQEKQLNQQQQQDLTQQLQAAMAAQANAMMTTWAPPPTQQFVAGEDKEKEKTAAAAVTTRTTLQSTQAVGETELTEGTTGRRAAVKAGEILFGVLTSCINSDENSPVMATVTTGRFKGAKLIGNFTLLDKKVIVTFTTMNWCTLPTSVSINAVAIDPDTAHTAMASHVNNHYLLRYGTLFASSFLSGYADAVSQSGSSTSSGAGGIVTLRDKLNPTEKIAVALGEVGSQYAAVLGNNFTRKPTITVNAGSCIGVLFMTDLFIDQPPQ